MTWGEYAARWTVAMIVALSAACGGRAAPGQSSPDGALQSSSDGAISEASPGGESIVTPPPVPLAHRSTASACPMDRPSGNASASGFTDTACTADSDCTQGQNGRCVLSLPNPAQCTYDQCFMDTDCSGGAVCACRNEPFGNNVCLIGACRVDSDCAGQYCSPSYGSCRNEGVVQYACHSSGDSCIDDSDCADGGDNPMLCSFDGSQGRWTCVLQSCPQ
jgi:hypothetical protein